MFKKFYDKLVDFIKDEYKYILFLFAFYIFLSFPVNYYIVTGGGISDVGSRIKLSSSYKSKGSFNISYVTELKGTIAAYLVSYIIPDWERTNMDDYKYDKAEDYEDLAFRSDIDLKSANDNAIKLAYTLANKEYKITSTKVYVTGTFDKPKTNLKIRDEILSINDKTYNTLEGYKDYLQSIKNEYVTVRVIRDKKEKNIKCKLHEIEGSKVLGVTLGVINSYKTDPKIEIKFKDSESGSSGGLITTLDIYNKLTKNDLTKSRKIAGTGTVDSNGNVGEIGGVKYKLLGAVKKKADIFLVPNGSNYKECIKLKKKRNLKIKIIGVNTVEEAINKLNK
ncbi:MAG: hypothetical protein E7160_05305 [Firmicutes bacterium]|nr:hypothetical protein [Bacillota bacterium]